MDGKGISSAQGGDDGRGHSLKIRRRGNKLWLAGTLRVGRRSFRVRETTGVDCRAPDAEDRAHAIRIRREAEILDQAVHGKTPAILFAKIAANYVTAAQPRGTQLAAVEELGTRFGHRLVDEIGEAEIEAFYRTRFPWQKPETRARHEKALAAIFSHPCNRAHRKAMPDWTRTKTRRRRGLSLGKQFAPGEGELIVENAAPHARPILATLLVTGARPTMVLNLRREHFLLVPGRGRIFFPKTKNGNAYERPLADYAVEILTAWLASRRDGHAEMFLTHRGRPYRRQVNHGGQVAHAFNSARDKAVAVLTEAGRPERARVIAQATPSWFRKSLANNLRDLAGADIKTIMEAGMWESAQVVLDHYMTRESPGTETAIRALPFGTKLTQAAEQECEKGEKSTA